MSTLCISFVSLSLVVIRLDMYFFFILAWINLRWASCIFLEDDSGKRNFFNMRYDFCTFRKYRASYKTRNRRLYPLEYSLATRNIFSNPSTAFLHFSSFPLIFYGNPKERRELDAQIPAIITMYISSNFPRKNARLLIGPKYAISATFPRGLTTV